MRHQGTKHVGRIVPRRRKFESSLVLLSRISFSQRVWISAVAIARGCASGADPVGRCGMLPPGGGRDFPVKSVILRRLRPEDRPAFRTTVDRSCPEFRTGNSNDPEIEPMEQTFSQHGKLARLMPFISHATAAFRGGNEDGGSGHIGWRMRALRAPNLGPKPFRRREQRTPDSP